MVLYRKSFVISLYLLLFLLYIDLDIYAQCNPPDQLPTINCSEGPLSCLSNACYTTLNQPFVCCSDFCGSNTIINNPQYFQFISVSDIVEIDILVNNCSAGMGLQSAIVTSCNWQPCPGGIVPCPDILACNAGASPGDTMVLMASGLTIGQTYWLLVDGSNGANCLYTINYISGTFAPQIDEDITTGYAVPNIVCQGLDKFTMNAAPAIPNAHGYLWNLGWNDQVVTSTLPTDTIEIENNAPPGIWDICVQAFSGCDTSDIPFCFTVEIIELNDIEKAPETFCSEEFPFDWYGTNITGPGTYDHSFNNPVGCPYDSIWTIESEPEPLVNFNYTVNDLQIQFENLSTTANEFSWNFGDGVSSSQINPTHTYSKPGSFLIELIGLSGCGSDTINKIVVLKSNSNETILITPNGDNVNDILVINGIEAFPKNELTIVNRWGDVVYKAQPYMNDWGGEGKDGSLLTQGIYYFILKHVGAQLPQSGDIVILK